MDAVVSADLGMPVSWLSALCQRIISKARNTLKKISLDDDHFNLLRVDCILK